MRTQQEQQTLHFIFTVLAIKMKVKFPCKMMLDHASSPLTNQVIANEDGKFVFDQEIRIKDESEKLFFEISVSLITEKGAKYASGVIKLYHNQLIRSEGQRLAVSLARCLDQEAIAELRIDKVIHEKINKPKNIISTNNQRFSNQKHMPDNFYVSPQSKIMKKHQYPQQLGETKSESYFPVTGRKYKKQQEEIRSRQYIPNNPHTNLNQRKQNYSPKSKNKSGLINLQNKNAGYEFALQFEKDRDKIMEAEVYKENYQKLKQKYMKQAEVAKNQQSKRVSLESNENNYKLEIVRLKLKNQELQKLSSEKSSKVKELGSIVCSMQQRQMDVNYLREELSNKEHTIHMLEDTILTLSKDNDQIRSLNKDISYKTQEKLLVFQNQMELTISRNNSKIYQLERQNQQTKDIIQQKDIQIVSKNEMLEKQKKIIFELEKNIQNKLFEYDSILQHQKMNHKNKQHELKQKYEEMGSQVNKLSKDKEALQEVLQKMKNQLLKSEYQHKLYLQESHSLKMELEDYKLFKDKHNELLKQYKIMSEQKVHNQKNYEKAILQKQNVLNQITKENKKQLESLKKIIKDLEDKNKSLNSKLIESEEELTANREGLQKNKKTQEHYSKQLTDLKEKQKLLKKSLKNNEQQYEQVKKEASRYKQKTSVLVQNLKSEMLRFKEEANKFRVELESQLIKNEQLTETNADLNMSMVRLKMGQEFAEEKCEQIANSSQQKHHNLQTLIKDHQNVIEILEENLRASKNHQKEYVIKLQKCQYQINLIVEKNQAWVKELKISEESKRLFENQLKLKNQEITQLQKKHHLIQEKHFQTNQSFSQIKDELQMSKSQLQKSKKIIQILQKDIDKFKSDIITHLSTINSKQKQIDQKTVELRRNKEAIATFQMKISSSKKQSDKFKESITDALNGTVSQLLHSISNSISDTRSSSLTSVDFSRGYQKNMLDFGNDLISALNTISKESKNTIFKISQKNKNLEKDLEVSRQEISKYVDTHNRNNYQQSNIIEHLQEELRTIKNAKGQLEVQFHQEINEFQKESKKQAEDIEKLEGINNELQFSLASLKLEYEATLQELDKRVHQHQREKQKMEDNLNYQQNVTQKLEKKLYQSEVQLMNLNSVWHMEKEQAYKKDLQIEEMGLEKEKIIKELESNKKALKQAIQNLNDLEIQLATVQEVKEKYEIMLNEEEGKAKQLQMFSTNILKEKEIAIKNQLEKNQQITEYQNKIYDIIREKQHQEDQKIKLAKEIEEYREINKKHVQQIKELQFNLKEEVQKNIKAKEKIKEIERLLQENHSESIAISKKYEESIAKLKSNQNQQNSQSQEQQLHLEHELSEAVETNQNLQIAKKKLEKEVNNCKQQLIQLEENIFIERENNQSLTDQIQRYKLEIQDYRQKLEEGEKMIEELLQENKEKDQNMFEMGSKIYQYQQKCKEIEEEKFKDIQEINSNWTIKYEESCEEIEQKIEFIEKEKDYFKEKLSEKEEELNKKNQESKHKQIEEIELKKMYEDKIKRLEEEKLQMLTEKNKQLNRTLDQNKMIFQNIRNKEAETRKISHQLEISRNTILKLETRLKEIQNEKSNQVKAYQAEIENLRKKELNYKNLKDQIKTNQWNSEREVRKCAQAFMKKMLDLEEKDTRNEILTLVKGFQENILQAIEVPVKD